MNVAPSDLGAWRKAGWPDLAAKHFLALVAIWALTVALSGFFALLMGDAAVMPNGTYVPMANDSFYHARRILDALGPRGFYQFDTRLHAPAGAWIPWPWAYDYLMAKAAQAVIWIEPGLSPLAVIAHVPLFWLTVNSALFLAAASALGLSLEMRLVAMLCFALSPFTQLLHVVGMIDHHYIEFTFILLATWLGLRWLQSPGDKRWAAALGAALGLAPGFHTALFVLQIPLLACIFVLWLRNEAPPRASLAVFGAALLAALQLVLWPAATFRAGMFDFGLLSLFHLYVAFGTSACLLYLGTRPRSRGNLAGFGVLVLVLGAPVAAQALRGLTFVSGRFSILPDIIEAQSVYRLFTQSFGAMGTAGYYSWLLLLAPVFLALHAYRVCKETAGDRLYYSLLAVFGLGLMLAQFRFYYYGFFAFVTAGLLLVEQARRRYGWHRGGVLVGVLLAVLVAYQPVLRSRLFQIYALSADPDYEVALGAYGELGRLCKTDPGIVLAGNDDGNPILYHSDCSVIANNFILSKSDEQSLDRVQRLMSSPPEEIRAHNPDIKYLLLRANRFGFVHDGRFGLASDSPIVQQLFLPAEPPPGFTLISKFNTGADEVRLYRIDPEPAATG
jgi:hypothetical protein